MSPSNLKGSSLDRITKNLYKKYIAHAKCTFYNKNSRSNPSSMKMFIANPDSESRAKPTVAV